MLCFEFLSKPKRWTWMWNWNRKRQDAIALWLSSSTFSRTSVHVQCCSVAVLQKPNIKNLTCVGKLKPQRNVTVRQLESLWSKLTDLCVCLCYCKLSTSLVTCNSFWVLLHNANATELGRCLSKACQHSYRYCRKLGFSNKLHFDTNGRLLKNL